MARTSVIETTLTISVNVTSNARRDAAIARAASS